MGIYKNVLWEKNCFSSNHFSEESRNLFTDGIFKSNNFSIKLLPLKMLAFPKDFSSGRKLAFLKA